MWARLRRREKERKKIRRGGDWDAKETDEKEEAELDRGGGEDIESRND